MLLQLRRRQRFTRRNRLIDLIKLNILSGAASAIVINSGRGILTRFKRNLVKRRAIALRIWPRRTGVRALAYDIVAICRTTCTYVGFRPLPSARTCVFPRTPNLNLTFRPGAAVITKLARHVARFCSGITLRAGAIARNNIGACQQDAGSDCDAYLSQFHLIPFILYWF
jgi:hypothetical protein